MLPNHARRSLSNSSSETKSFISCRSLGRSFSVVFFALLLSRARSNPWWCVGPNELFPAAIALLLRGSTFTLYGGSVLTSWILAPARRESTSVGFPLSPHRSRGAPHIQR